jgi:adenine/guanine phosphoribosyltransferase-like PRPP-binding protein
MNEPVKEILDVNAGRLACGVVETGPHARYGMYKTKRGHHEMVHRCLAALMPIADTFDAVLCTGLSGTIPGSTIALWMDKELMVIRPQGRDGTTIGHGYLVEGEVGHREAVRYLIVDDFVSSGATLKKLMKYCPTRNGSRIVGVCLYSQPLGFHDEKLEQGRSLLFTVTDTWGGPDQQYELWRRAKDSILFDVKPVVPV